MTSSGQAPRASATLTFPGRIEVVPTTRSPHIENHWEADLIFHAPNGPIAFIVNSGDGEKRSFEPGAKIGLREPVGPTGSLLNAQELVIDGELSNITLVLREQCWQRLAARLPGVSG